MFTMHVNKNEAAGTRRRFYFFLVDATDGHTPETGEAGGQPEVSINGDTWSTAEIGTLTHIGNGYYYADLTQSAINIDGPSVILARYKSAATREAQADNAIIVGDPIANAAALMFNDVVLDRAAGTVNVYNRDGYQGGAGTKLFTLTPSRLATNQVKMARS